MKLFDVVLRFDRQISNRIEQFCQKTQRTIGWTNFTWMKIVIALFGLALGLSLIVPNLFIALSLLFIFGVLGSLLATSMEKTANERLQKGVANPLKEFPFSTFTRVWLIGLSLWKPLLSSTALPAVLIFYLMQCDPLPPCDSKLKRWFESLFLTPVRVHSK